MQVFYRPPQPGTKPFEFEGLGGVHIFYPQDQIWKKVKKKHKIRPRQDPIMKDFVRNEKGEIQYIWGTVKDWEVDEEETKKLKAGKRLPPADSHEVSDEMWDMLGKGKHAALRRERFKRREDIEGAVRSRYDELMREGDKRLAALNAEIDARERSMREQIELMNARMLEMSEKEERLAVVERKLAEQEAKEAAAKEASKSKGK